MRAESSTRQGRRQDPVDKIETLVLMPINKLCCDFVHYLSIISHNHSYYTVKL